MLNRRVFILGAPLVLAGCQSTGMSLTPLASRPETIAAYAARPEERFPLPAVDVKKIPQKYLRQRVRYETNERPGTIVVDTRGPFLYHTEEGGSAMRYGIGVGREGFGWSGNATIAAKRKWPTWTPPSEMIERRPELEKYRGGMKPSLENPLGARALYLFEGGRDTLYRIHGTNEPESIGLAVSSGCIRMFNQDVIHLYENTPRRTQVVVLQHDRGPGPFTGMFG